MVDTERATELQDAWDARVHAERDQVERCRLVDEAPDFYAPVTARFIEDPRREGDELLEALLRLVEPGETWLDIGAGAGRYALPLALRAGKVVALDPSPGMLAALRDGMTRHGVANIDVHEGRWPQAAGASSLRADVAFIAHVGYDQAPIGPFLDAMDEAAERRCVAVMLEHSPASFSAPLWTAVHGVERVSLPACPELVAILEARGSRPRLQRLPQPARRWPDVPSLLAQLRHQLWIPDEGPANDLLVAAVNRAVAREPEGVRLPAATAWVGIVDWDPAR